MRRTSCIRGRWRCTSAFGSCRERRRQWCSCAGGLALTVGAEIPPRAWVGGTARDCADDVVGEARNQDNQRRCPEGATDETKTELVLRGRRIFRAQQRQRARRRQVNGCMYIFETFGRGTWSARWGSAGIAFDEAVQYSIMTRTERTASLVSTTSTDIFVITKADVLKYLPEVIQTRLTEVGLWVALFSGLSCAAC